MKVNWVSSKELSCPKCGHVTLSPKEVDYIKQNRQCQRCAQRQAERQAQLQAKHEKRMRREAL